MKKSFIITTSLLAIPIILILNKKIYKKVDIIDNSLFIKQYRKMIESSEICIPKNVYQTYKSPIPKCIEESIDTLKNQNKDFNFYFFDDDMCRDFIKEHFDNSVLNAFDTLIPGAYKADLWRYCIMYIKGGIYIDCKYIMEKNNTLNSLLDNEYYVRDILRKSGEYVYQAILVSKPKNELYNKCIQKIVENINLRNVGRCDLDVSGPRLFADQMLENIDYLVKRGKFNIIDLKNIGSGNITFNDKLFMKIYKREEYYSHINKNNRYGKIYPKIYKTL
jgi:hypothetical protein